MPRSGTSEPAPVLAAFGSVARHHHHARWSCRWTTSWAASRSWAGAAPQRASWRAASTRCCRPSRSSPSPGATPIRRTPASGRCARAMTQIWEDVRTRDRLKVHVAAHRGLELLVQRRSGGSPRVGGAPERWSRYGRMSGLGNRLKVHVAAHRGRLELLAQRRPGGPAQVGGARGRNLPF